MKNKFDLIEEYLIGGLSVKEQTEFEELLRNDPELRKEFKDAIGMYYEAEIKEMKKDNSSPGGPVARAVAILDSGKKSQT